MNQYQMDPGEYDPRLAFQQYRQTMPGALDLSHVLLLQQFLKQQHEQGAPYAGPTQRIPGAPAGVTGVRG